MSWFWKLQMKKLAVEMNFDLKQLTEMDLMTINTLQISCTRNFINVGMVMHEDIKEPTNFTDNRKNNH